MSSSASVGGAVEGRIEFMNDTTDRTARLVGADLSKESVRDEIIHLSLDDAADEAGDLDQIGDRHDGPGAANELPGPHGRRVDEKVEQPLGLGIDDKCRGHARIVPTACESRGRPPPRLVTSRSPVPRTEYGRPGRPQGRPVHAAVLGRAGRCRTAGG